MVTLERGASEEGGIGGGPRSGAHVVQSARVDVFALGEQEGVVGAAEARANLVRVRVRVNTSPHTLVRALLLTG